MWVKWVGTQDAGASSSYGPVTARQKNGSFSNQIIALNGSNPETAKIIWRPYNGGINAVTSRISPGNGKWRYIVVTYSSGSHKLYIDGLLDATSGTTGSVNNDSSIPLSIGAWTGDGGGYSKGFIDQVKIYKYIRTASQIKADYAARGATKGVAARFGDTDLSRKLSSGLVGYWKMDEATGSTGASWTALDSSGNGNNGVGVSDAGPGVGKFGNGGSFDGTGDYVTISHNSVINSDNQTISLWFKGPSSNPTDSKGLIFKAPTTGFDREFGISIKTDGTVTFSIFDGSADSSGNVNSTSTVTDGQWHYVVGVKEFGASGDKFYLYLDGTLENSMRVSYNGAQNSNEIVLGKVSSASNATRYYNGQIDEVRIYNRALDPSEVKALYEYAPGPVGWWKMDDASGSSAQDSSGNGNNGSLGSGNSAPTWTNGKFGKGLKFDGNDYVDLGTTLINNLGQYNAVTFNAWVKLNTLSGDNAIVGRGSDSGQSPWIMYRGSENSFQMYADSYKYAKYTQSSPNINEWYYVTGVYDNGTIAIYVNGVKGAITDTGATLVLGSNPFTIGSSGGTTRFLNGVIDDVKIYNYARTQAQIIDDMNAGHPAVGSPVGHAVGYWEFNEGYGSTVHNSGNSGTALDGIITNASWTNDGKNGKALSFNGADTLVDLGVNTVNSDMNGAAAVTVETWMKPASYPGGTSRARMMSIHLADGYSGIVLSVYGDDQVEVAGRSGTGDSFQTARYTLTNPTSWHHVIGVFDYPNDQVLIYVDGKLALTQSVTFANAVYTAGTPTDNHDSLGAYKTLATGDFYNGILDATKIYNFALTADQVKAEYAQGKVEVMGALSTDLGGTSPSWSGSRAYCVPGDASTCNAPIAEWNFDNITGNTAPDTSGNGYGGNFGAGTSAPSWTVGKVGRALSFDGNDYVESALVTNATNNVSISAWFKNTDYTDDRQIIVSNGTGSGSGYQIAINQDSEHDGSLRILYGGIAWYDTGVNITDSQWHFVALTLSNASPPTKTVYLDGKNIYSNGSGTPAVPGLYTRIGHDSTTWGFFIGLIDNVRIYNYARTPAQIAWEYNRGAPIAWYQFNDCTGTTAYNAARTGDNKAAGNDGTITIGAGGSQTSVGTCTTSGAWYNGASGKHGSSLNFDGTDDYVETAGEVLDPSSGDLSISAWFKQSVVLNDDNTIVGQLNGTGTGRVLLGISSGGKLDSFIGGTRRTANTTLTPGTWYHGAVTLSGLTLKLYVNGRVDGTFTLSSVESATGALRFGISKNTAQYFKGQIDDGKIFNYALTPQQVKMEMNSGAVRFE